MNKEELFAKMAASVIEGKMEEAEKLAREAVKSSLNLTEVIEKGFVPGINKAGDLWEKGEYFLPELITSAECIKRAMAVLQPEVEKAGKSHETKGRVVIGTVEGDIHDIGKNLVSSMLQANGFEVYDLGADVRLELFIDTAASKKADFICLSALLTTTMVNQKKLIDLLKEKKLRDKFRVVVGGAPVTRKWAQDIGADGFGDNAVAAVRLLNDLRKKG